jgi:hypothetical protein
MRNRGMGRCPCVHNDPPSGMIVHTVVEIGGRLTIIDVWETAAALTEFEEKRLGPAFDAVAQRMGIDTSQLPEAEHHVLETLDLVLGR